MKNKSKDRILPRIHRKSFKGWFSFKMPDGSPYAFKHDMRKPIGQQRQFDRAIKRLLFNMMTMANIPHNKHMTADECRKALNVEDAKKMMDEREIERIEDEI